MDYEQFKILAIALGLGLLVGLQKEYEDNKMAGIRTFALVTVFGSIVGLVSQQLNTGIIIAVGAVCLVALLVTVNVFKYKNDRSYSYGQTTEVAFLLMYSLGAYLVFGNMELGVSIGAITALLLYHKSTLGGLVNQLKEKDIRAIMQFAAITLIVLPILPDEYFGPYKVLNPRNIWMMVVLIVGLGMTGYFMFKVLSKDISSIASGLLGGLISSTATTVTFARRSLASTGAAGLAAFVIVTASTVAMVRVLLEIAVVSPSYFKDVAPPLLIELLFMAVLTFVLFFYSKDKNVEELPEPDNPAELKSAIWFGVLYALILVAVAVAKDYFGESGLYIVSIISGLTDMDAITLSLAHSLNNEELVGSLVWKLILVASLSNLLFKGVLVTILGTRKLAKYIWILFGMATIFGLCLLFWY